MLARRLDVDAEAALEGANRKFRDRFTAVEAELRRQGLPTESAGFELLERLWDEIKAARRRGGLS